MGKTLGTLGLLVAVFLAGHFAWPQPTRVDVRTALDTIVRYDDRWHTRLHVDTVRAESVVVFHDTALVLIARADSLPPDSAVPLLRRACFTLDTALTTCESRVNFWRADADTVRSERDRLASLLRQMHSHGWKTDVLILGIGFGISRMIR